MAAKKITTSSLAELLKRVPPNQMKNFEAFRDKTMEYIRRVNQYPEKLPRVDWEFYRNNVRDDYVQMVDQFQVKYEELKHVFAARHEALDFSKYYKELDEQTEQAQNDVQNYIEESNARIKIYENEIERLKSLTPYESMTLEQFVIEREDIAQYIPGQGKPLFWPHEPIEQIPNYCHHFDKTNKKLGLEPATKDKDEKTTTVSRSEATNKSDLNANPDVSDNLVETKPHIKAGELKDDKIMNDESNDTPKSAGSPASPPDSTTKDPTKK